MVYLYRWAIQLITNPIRIGHLWLTSGHWSTEAHQGCIVVNGKTKTSAFHKVV